MKKAYKVLSILTIAIMIVACFSNVFAAIEVSSINSTETLEGDVDTKMADVGSTVFTIITNAGIILSVVVLAILGIKYMMGSTEEKAEYKKAMMPYLVGAVLVFGASTIATIVVDFGKSF